MNEEDELFKKCFMKTLKKLAEEPDEVINYNEQLKKYNNLLKEKIKLQQELKRKDNEIKQLREDIVNHIKIASEYKEQMIIKDNIINELKKDLEFLITPTRGDNSFHKNPIYVLEIQEIINKLKGK